VRHVSFKVFLRHLTHNCSVQSCHSLCLLFHYLSFD
jgi:hypothetical protein